MFDTGAAFFMAGVSEGDLILVNEGLSDGPIGSSVTFSSAAYGAPADANRYVIVCVTGEDNVGSEGALSVTDVEWGGTGLTELVSRSTKVSNTGLCCAIWGGLITSGTSGDLVIDIDDNEGLEWDSIGVTTFVISTLDSTTPVDTGSGATNGSSTLTASNLETESDGGIIVMLAVGAASTTLFTSAVGNASTGALTENIDTEIESDHRQAVYSKGSTPAGTTEDFTITRSAAGFWAMCAVTMQ